MVVMGPPHRMIALQSLQCPPQGKAGGGVHMTTPPLLPVHRLLLCAGGNLVQIGLARICGMSPPSTSL